LKIYVAAVQALRKKERQDETQVTTKIDGETISGLMPYYGYMVKNYGPINKGYSNYLEITCLMPCYAETGHSHPLIV
jgi:hypothetical protein